MASIWTRQVEPPAVVEQSAAAVLHRRVHLMDATRTSVATTLSALGFVAVFVPDLEETAALLGLTTTLIISALVNTGLRLQLRRAVLVQESFDTRVFGIPWNRGLAGDPLPREEIERLARKLKPNSARAKAIADGWYDDTAALRFPLDVLACQWQNTAWDIRLRHRYRNIVAGVLMLLLLAGVIVGYAKSLTLDDLILRFYLPSLPAFAVGIDILAAQRNVISEKQHLLTFISAVSDSHRSAPGSTGKMGPIRQVQDGVFSCRTIAVRAPNTLYRLFRDRDEADFEAQIHAWAAGSP